MKNHDPDDDVARNKTYYENCWRVTLRSILGWNTETIERWIGQFELGLTTDLWHWIYHDEPVVPVIPVIIPAKLRAKLRGASWVRLQKDIKHLLQGNDGPSFFENVHYDWDGAGQRLGALFRSYE